jgi:predicted secreted hydrolase
MRALRALPALMLVAVVASLSGGACSPAGRILANDPPTVRPVPSRTPAAVPVADPQPVVLPRDDAAHDRLTEWWYYTGHLRAADGRRFGFEFVVFRAERGAFPVSWASHLALTDETTGAFRFDQRSQIGQAVDRAGTSGLADGRFDLAVAGGPQLVGPGQTPPSTPITTAPASGSIPWRMSGGGGHDHLEAAAPTFGLSLDLDAGDRPVALHDRDGFVDFGPGGGSYYYSRTRMAASGTLTIDGLPVAVDGLGWFDHQWGDFIAVGAGGWDWFALNLDDGTDITLSLVRDQSGGYPLVYGTLVRPDRSVVHLPREAFVVSVTGQWTSPTTGVRYPAGWHVSLPGEQLEIDLSPTVAGQELDTRPTTGVIYWEGSQRVTGTRGGRAIGGDAYVELTGYGPGLAAGH